MSEGEVSPQNPLSRESNAERQPREEVEIATKHLKPKDLVGLQCSVGENRTERIAFQVRGKVWEHLALSEAMGPDSRLVGTVQGNSVPAAMQDQDAYYMGSSLGGDMRRMDAIVTGQYSNFSSPNLPAYTTPRIEQIQVFRPNATGAIQRVEPDQLASAEKTEVPHHNQRLEQIQQLMTYFGFGNFDFRDGKKASTGYSTKEDSALGIVDYQDERFIAQYVAQMALGNCLAVLDRQTNQWTEFKYYDYLDQDILQIAMVDLPDLDLDKHFWVNLIVSPNKLLNAKMAIATHNSSNAGGLDAINYRPSEEEARDVLQMPLDADLNMFTVIPDVHILPDNEVRVSHLRGVAEHPGEKERVEGMVSVTPPGDGERSLNLNRKVVTLKNPDLELQKLLTEMSKKEQAKKLETTTKKEGRLTAMAKRFGRSIKGFRR